ncbi:MAG: class I SAM-dependent methyltransferase [Desulfobacteraceae bacterium]|uniref:Class I SAM-dependent methyltransferase n=1 Tax=Candidatus Desulfacyla euxinica TaxID=2841693 RepID=A0A8J6T436_9DELT|nr:class I SAM-dependent methyltransferase [Candidatus Desulfacyla euxinica]MBL6978374.1 class I SAM-dependent methyltransferase [Desulfobacteraceae bacterium]MBL7217146.1 class I SAM-dependent methyltransferase [Desulfobacteraceae bacterium]
MFDRLSARYDRLNRLMSFGLDRLWRQRVVCVAELPEEGLLLDLGAGTGDIAMEAARQHSKGRVTAADFSLGMMRKGRERQEGSSYDRE